MVEVLKALAAPAAAAGFLFGVYQYFVAQKWKKAEFAANLLLRFHSDPDLDACCKILDWDKRTMLVPPNYQEIAKASTFRHNWDNLTIAMAPEIDVERFTWQQMLYRDLFDKFFTYLAEINHFLKIKLIKKNQVATLRYWLKCIAKPRFSKGDVFGAFLEHYGYTGVTSLMKRFGIKQRGGDREFLARALMALEPREIKHDTKRAKEYYQLAARIYGELALNKDQRTALNELEKIGRERKTKLAKNKRLVGSEKKRQTL